jgi:signal peptidase I
MASRRTDVAGRRRLRPGYVVVVVAAATLAVRTFLLTPVGVAGASMEPTVHDGDVVLVARTVTTTAELRRGDLVVFRDPLGSLSVKRVLGLPGDRVAMLDARLTVDGEFVDEPYVDLSRIDGTYLGQVVVPDGSVFVLGDNRSRSIDSREYGPVAEDAVLGRVLLHW